MAKSDKLQISEFDIELFRKLTQCYLSTNMLLGLLPTFGAKAKIRKKASLQDRLKRLYDEGYINRDQRLSRGQGVNEYYYFLAKKGAAFFEELEHAKPGRGILRRLEMGSQEHAFMVSEVLVKMDKDIFNIRNIATILGFIRENYFEIAIPAARKKDPVKSLKPDGTWFLQINGQNHLIFLEVDLSTEPVSSVNPYRRTFRRKIEIYSDFRKYFKEHNLINLFGRFPGYRVITVCKSPERVISLMDTARIMGKKDMFWFANIEQIKNNNILFDSIWRLPDGKTKPLFKGSPR